MSNSEDDNAVYTYQDAVSTWEIRFNSKLVERYAKDAYSQSQISRFVNLLNSEVWHYIKKYNDQANWAQTYKRRADNELIERNKRLQDAIVLAVKDADAYLKQENERLEDKVETLKEKIEDLHKEAYWDSLGEDL